MKDAKPFSVFESPLGSRILIEASAGTGKTYNIIGIYIRLLIEKKATLDQILVVTFTKMATKELKDRILNQLRNVLRALESGRSFDDPFLEGVLGNYSDMDSASRVIRKAIRNFDEAKIYTIHGFCQQVLREESLTSGVPFDIEVSQTDDMLIEAAGDFWRTFINKHSDSKQGRYLIDKLMSFAPGPDQLLDLLMPAIQYRDYESAGAGDFDPYSVSERIIGLREELRELWIEAKNEITAQLLESDVRYMTDKNVYKRVAAMESFLMQPGYAEDTFEKIKFFLPSYFNENLKKNKDGVPVHRFYDLCERYANETENMSGISTWLLEYAARNITGLRHEKSREKATLTYEDLLGRLLEALSSKGMGEALAAKLRKKYPYALVDEFQDTDPVQYRIFGKIYSSRNQGTSLMMIGDPKQAIYAFRGADLYAYIRAREEVAPDSRYTLRKNFRSTPKLIEAVNILFTTGHETPFLEKEISYHNIKPGGIGEPGALNIGSDGRAPLRFYCHEGISTKSELRTLILKETAVQVARLIQQGIRRQAVISDGGQSRRLSSGDIAVLVHSHRDAETIKEYLRILNIGSATYSREKVFESREAERLEQFITAVLDPHSRTAGRAAVAAGFFGVRLSDVVNFLHDEEQLLQLSADLQELNECWYRDGVYPMMRKLLFELNGLSHIAKLHNSERVITNIQQLLELAAMAEIEHGFDPPGLLRWFRKKISDAGSDDEEMLRLESDENLVKLTTIHNSKGLEFPVVFCPTLWNAREYMNREKTIETFHKAEYPFDRIVDFQQASSPERDEARCRSHFEEISEEIRKAYVAVTRAKYECRIFWGASNTSQLSGLGALLAGEDVVKKSIREKLKLGKMNSFDESEFTSFLKDLAGRNPGIISYHELKDEPGRMEPLKPKYTEEEISVKQYNGKAELRRAKQLFSFSSLTSLSHTAAIEPDYDQYLEGFIEYAEAGPAAGSLALNIFHFPKGKTAGTFIHKLFEHDDFDFRDETMNRSIIGELIGNYGFEEKWTPVLDKMLTDVANADLNELSLHTVKPEEMLKEMEFYFPAGIPELDGVKKMIRNGRSNGRRADNSKSYLNGFIDLIVRQDNKYYIIDYKSNYLGDDIDDYVPRLLQEEIRKSDYDIQYHLYIVALIKYLKARDPNFSYLSFGGVYYLFVRGMRSGESTGVYFDRPREEIIENLQKLLYRDAKPD